MEACNTETLFQVYLRVIRARFAAAQGQRPPIEQAMDDGEGGNDARQRASNRQPEQGSGAALEIGSLNGTGAETATDTVYHESRGSQVPTSQEMAGTGPLALSNTTGSNTGKIPAVISYCPATDKRGFQGGLATSKMNDGADDCAGVPMTIGAVAVTALSIGYRHRDWQSSTNRAVDDATKPTVCSRISFRRGAARAFRTEYARAGTVEFIGFPMVLDIRLRARSPPLHFFPGRLGARPESAGPGAEPEVAKRCWMGNQGRGRRPIKLSGRG
jgi:hypothetical protein